MQKQVLFHHRFKGGLVRVVSFAGRFRVNIFAANGQFSSLSFSSSSQAVAFARQFCGLKNSNQQLNLL